MYFVLAQLTLLVALLTSRAASKDSLVNIFNIPPEQKFAPDFQDLFDIACKPAPNVTDPCSGKGGEDLNPNGCTRPTAGGNRDPVRSYYYDSSLQRCVDYVFEGCAPGGNHFVSLAECSASCSPVCEQSAPVPSASSGETCYLNRLVWYYNKGEGRCVQTLWDGCKVTNNVFELELECTQTCGLSGVDRDRNDLSLNSVNAVVDDVSKFCDNFKPTTSSLATTRPPAVTTSTPRQSRTEERAISTRDSIKVKTSSAPNLRELPTLPDLLTPESVPTTGDGAGSRLCEQLTCVRQSTPIRSSLNFVSVFARTDCLEVVVRLNCRKGLTHRPSDPELDRLCELVRSGVERYWSRPDGITVSCPDERKVKVNVRVQLVSHWLGVNAKDVVVKVRGSGYDRCNEANRWDLDLEKPNEDYGIRKFHLVLPLT